MGNWEQKANSYNSDEYTPEQRKSWYSKVADAYNRVRPRYPQELIGRVVELTQLPANANILEFGCGPGTATTAFAELGFSMVCLEPSQESSQLAQKNCAQYPKVRIENTTFQEWELGDDKFDAVLSASAFHWIPAEIACSKAAAALRDHGYLILLWNSTALPKYEVYQILNQVYQTEAPSLAEYHSQEKCQI